jgi:uncharacterized peroxidase-related enzyme
MPHIDLPEGVAGIRSALQFRPETAEPLLLLAETLLRGESPLTRGERELIAAYVSDLNECVFCQSSHSVFAALQLDGGMAVVEHVKRDPATAPVSDKLRALLAIAAKVQVGGRSVSHEDVALPRSRGSSGRPTSRSTTPFSSRPRSACSTGTSTGWRRSRRRIRTHTRRWAGGS